MDETNAKRAVADAMRKAKAAASANDPRVTKQPEIGLGAAVRREIVAALNRVLSNEAILLVKTKKAHWDVGGPQFYALHKLWDEQHALIGERIDEIAERIRQLGGFPIATLGGWLEHAALRETPGQVPEPTEAVSGLLHDHELVVRMLRKVVEDAEQAKDRGTGDLLTDLMRDHENMAWMLRAFLEGEGLSPRVDARTSIPDFA